MVAQMNKILCSEPARAAQLPRDARDGGRLLRHVRAVLHTRREFYDSFVNFSVMNGLLET